MKKFTKSLLTLVLLVLAVGGAKAQEEVHATFANPTGITWDAENWTFSWTSPYGNQLHNIGLPSGNMTEYEKLVVDCDIISGDGYRFMFYATTKGTTAGGTTIITSSGKHEYKLADLGMDNDYLTKCSEICLSGYNGSGTVKVNDVYLVKSADPKAGAKKLLSEAITKGQMQTTFAKTTDSYNALQTAISDGQTELDKPSSTIESLEAAAATINGAIASFEYQDGYTTLTKEMANANVAYDLWVSTGLPYGTSNVDMNIYAELNEFDKFVVLTAAGQPRFCMNRITSGGQIGPDLASSEMIDIPPQGQYAEYTWAAEKYQTIDENKYTLDLKKIAADWNGLAKLNCIKGAFYNNVTVTDLLLYREITVGEYGYATFGSVSKNAKVNGVTAYAAIYNKETGKVDLTEVTNVPAGKGVVIEGAAGSYAPTFDVAPADIASDLKVSDGTVTGDGSTIYVLAKGGSGIGFYPLKSGNTLEAGKAYLQIAGPARGFIGFEGATGINEVNVNKAAAKTGKIYNLNGQIVSKPSKGLFIVDGKVVSF